MIHYVGMDCHRKSFRVCRRRSDGKIADETDLAGTRQALEEYCAAHLTAEDVVALEATFHSRDIARIVLPHVSRVVISNPMQTKMIARAKKKTDKVDARVLSDLLRAGYLPEVWLPDLPTQLRRDLCARRASLVSERTRIKNRIHSVLAAALIPLETTDLFGKKGLEWLAGLPLNPDQRAAVESDQRIMEAVQIEIDALEVRLQKDAWEEPRVKLLMTLPGINVAVAQTVLAAIGEVARFQTAEQLASYLGLVPSVHQSGDHCYHGPITRHGNPKARWMLIQAAQHVAAHPGPLGVFFRRLLKKKNRNVAVVACARKLIVIAWHMLTNNEPYRYAQPRPTQDKLAKLRVAVTRARKKTGPKKGAPASANQGTGTRSRRIPSLPDVYEQENLPPAKAPAEVTEAERRMLRESGAAPFAHSIQQPATLQRKAKAPAPRQEEPASGACALATGGEATTAAEGR